MRDKRKEFVAREMEVYKKRKLVREEGKKWGFNELLHFTTLNTLLVTKLLSVP